MLTYLSLGIIASLPQNVEPESLPADKCSLSQILIYDQVKSVPVMMGRDGGICWECKVV